MFVGIDSLDIERMKSLIENEKFLNKYFTPYEIKYANSTVNRTMRLAGLYAAKEAFLKAIEIGIGGGISLIEIEINHKKNGSPYINLSDNALKVVSILKIKEIKISITHTETTSSAICICF